MNIYIYIYIYMFHILQDQNSACSAKPRWGHTSDRVYMFCVCSTVTGLSAPTNVALDLTCADGATMSTGTSCLLTCVASDDKFVGTQPSCSLGVFDVGSFSCASKIVASDPAANDQFGHSVSVSGVVAARMVIVGCTV
jgi:hypothetical protein